MTTTTAATTTTTAATTADELLSDEFFLLVGGIVAAIAIAGAVGLSLASIARSRNGNLLNKRRHDPGILNLSNSKSILSFTNSETKIDDDRSNKKQSSLEYIDYYYDDPVFSGYGGSILNGKRRLIKKRRRKRYNNLNPTYETLSGGNFLNSLQEKFDRFFTEGKRYLNFLMNNEYETESGFESEQRPVQNEGRHENYKKTGVPGRMRRKRGVISFQDPVLDAERNVMEAVRVRDFFDCGKKMICELASSNGDTLSLDHLAIMDMVGSAIHPADSSLNLELDPKYEYRLARGVGNAGLSCSQTFRLCPFNNVAVFIDALIK